MFFCGPLSDGVLAGLDRHSWFDDKRNSGAVYDSYVEALDYLYGAEHPTAARKESIWKHRQSVGGPASTTQGGQTLAERRDTSL